MIVQREDRDDRAELQLLQNASSVMFSTVV